MRGAFGRLFGTTGGPGSAGGRTTPGGADGVDDDVSGLRNVVDALQRNMPGAGDFSFEGIQQLGNPVPMPVSNGGTELLELWLEPFGQDYWLQPGERFTVTSYGEWTGSPFETVHEPGRIQVWAASFFATVSFDDGTEVPGGHQRPREDYYED
ncbi:hypothetical protein OOK31_32830 [Streptomyces sp. NBC_00249]|uniref:hypothetical protein n=1 Tax=Streptomyces sp. NBC_00249 TaxID=2975690 RepID=UPI002253D9AB|nr:hypothetical protein [Streptomyces sp. NBC_00249]MCX5198618.1 hypothetical protein [Streptomyces sp. NBC_00249]